MAVVFDLTSAAALGGEFKIVTARSHAAGNSHIWRLPTGISTFMIGADNAFKIKQNATEAFNISKDNWIIGCLQRCNYYNYSTKTFNMVNCFVSGEPFLQYYNFNDINFYKFISIIYNKRK